MFSVEQQKRNMISGLTIREHPESQAHPARYHTYVHMYQCSVTFKAAAVEQAIFLERLAGALCFAASLSNPSLRVL